MNQTLTATQGRQQFFDVLDKVTRTPGRLFTITRQMGSSVTIVDTEYLDGLFETLDLLTEFPKLPREIAEAKREIALGDSKSWEEVKHDLGLDKRNKKDRNDISRRVFKTSTKRSRKAGR